VPQREAKVAHYKNTKGTSHMLISCVAKLWFCSEVTDAWWIIIALNVLSMYAVCRWSWICCLTHRQYLLVAWDLRMLQHWVSLSVVSLQWPCLTHSTLLKGGCPFYVNSDQLYVVMFMLHFSKLLVRLLTVRKINSKCF